MNIEHSRLDLACDRLVKLFFFLFFLLFFFKLCVDRLFLTSEYDLCSIDVTGEEERESWLCLWV